VQRSTMDKGRDFPLPVFCVALRDCARAPVPALLEKA
jgi:hypothetical protein